MRQTGEAPRLWGTPAGTFTPRQSSKDIDFDSLENVRTAIRTFSDPSLSQHKVFEDYTPSSLWDDDLSLYKVRHVLGAGAFGTVFAGYNPDERSTCAIKLVRTYRRDIKDIIREIRAMATLHHPNIVPLHCACVTNDGVLAMVMPSFFSLGKIIAEIEVEVREDQDADENEVVQILPEDVVHNIIRQICCGLAFMHSHNFAHRDLKADNFLLDRDGKIKIADFGLSRKFSPAKNEGYGILKTPVGTKIFLAPEVAEGFASDYSKPYDIRAETWAVGICTLELFFGQLPFEKGPNPDVIDEIINLERMENSNHDVNWNNLYVNGEKLRKRLSKYCKNFIDSCLKLDPDERETVSYLFINHFWMLQPPISDFKMLESLLGEYGEENLKYKIENNTRRRMEEHRRGNNSHEMRVGAKNAMVMCISLSFNSEERFFKKFIVSSDLKEKNVERIVHQKLFGYIYDEQINLYDFIAVCTEAVRTFRRALQGDESPGVVDLEDRAVCVVSWNREFFFDEENPRIDKTKQRPDVKPRRTIVRTPGKWAKSPRTPGRG